MLFLVYLYSDQVKDCLPKEHLTSNPTLLTVLRPTLPLALIQEIQDPAQFQPCSLALSRHWRPRRRPRRPRGPGPAHPGLARAGGGARRQGDRGAGPGAGGTRGRPGSRGREGGTTEACGGASSWGEHKNSEDHHQPRDGAEGEKQLSLKCLWLHDLFDHEMQGRIH